MELPLSLLLGAGTLAAILWGRGRRPSNAAGAAPQGAAATSGGSAAMSSGGAGVAAAKSGRAPFELLKGRWVWPVPITRGRRPDISSGWGSPRGDRQHEGVDIMFRRIATDPFPVGSPNGSKLFVMPDETLVVAACDGYLWFSGKTPRGWTVEIDHSDAIPQKVVSYYTHMEKLFVELTSRGRGRIRVYAGQPLGIIGGDPLDARHLKHLHFALWAGNAGDAFDAAPFMRRWEMIRDPRESGPANPPAASGSPPPAGAASGAGSPLQSTQGVPVCRVGETTTVGPGGFPVCTPAPISAAPSASPIPAALTLTPSPAFPQSRLVSSPAQRRQARAAAARSAALTFRNARLVFRPVGSSGEPYPKWLRELRGQSGVYFIRERSADGSEAELVYIGQSQAGRLYETLTRHFQSWRRIKGFWRGYGEGSDPGMTYARDRVEVAVRITPPSRAVEEEARFIRAMKPRDNVLGLHDDDADQPF